MAWHQNNWKKLHVQISFFKTSRQELLLVFGPKWCRRSSAKTNTSSVIWTWNPLSTTFGCKRQGKLFLHPNCENGSFSIWTVRQVHYSSKFWKSHTLALALAFSRRCQNNKKCGSWAKQGKNALRLWVLPINHFHFIKFLNSKHQSYYFMWKNGGRKKMWRIFESQWTFSTGMVTRPVQLHVSKVGACLANKRVDRRIQ